MEGRQGDDAKEGWRQGVDGVAVARWRGCSRVCTPAPHTPRQCACEGGPCLGRVRQAAALECLNTGVACAFGRGRC